MYECEATGAAAYQTGKGTWYYEQKYDKETKLLKQFRFNRYAKGELHPTSSSPFPWS